MNDKQMLSDGPDLSGRQPPCKGAFLMRESLRSSVLDSQVIRHIARMRRMGYDMELWVISGRSSHYADNETVSDRLQGSGVPIRLIKGIRDGVPFSEVLNAMVLSSHLRRHARDLEIMHCRTEAAAAIGACLRPFHRFRLIWDARGDSVAEKRASLGVGSLPRRCVCAYIVLKSWVRTLVAARMCDAAIFVSEPLRQRVAPRLEPSRFRVIPCAADSEVFRFRPAIRAQTRGRLGFASHHTVLVFSGSLAPYQMFPETAAIFARLLQQDQDLRWLVLTRQTQDAARYMDGIPPETVRLLSVEFGEVNDYLNAADIGIMLRADSPVNWVASPVKFAEYSLAGLPVITTSAVPQAYSTAERLGNLIACDEELSAASLRVLPDAERASLSRRAAAILSREAMDERYRAVYDGE